MRWTMVNEIGSRLKLMRWNTNDEVDNGRFWILSNIYDGSFCENSWWLKAVNPFMHNVVKWSNIL